jgi:putative holliday junction resolvase
MGSGGGVTLLGFDYGRRRIGVAVGNTLTRNAQPLTTLAATDAGPDWARVAALLEEWSPARLVVGVPYNDGASGQEMVAEAQRFARRLHGRFGVPVDTVDEALSSSEAYGRLKAGRSSGRRGPIAKEEIDSAAAAVILQDWLDNHP